MRAAVVSAEQDAVFAESEIAAIRRIVDAARREDSSVVLVRGEPGAGKTTLLEAAADAAGDDVRVLHCAGVQAEAELSYAALTEVLYPLRHHIPRLPDAYAHALNTALGLADAASVDRLTLGAATLALLAEAAERQPMLLLVDDAHWMDEASGAAIRFAVRRLRAEGIGVVVAVRVGEPSPFDEAGLDAIDLSGLDRQRCAALVARLIGEPPVETVVDRLLSETAGNPLAITEICRAWHGCGDLDDHAPLPVGARLTQVYRRELDTLADDARLAVAVAAASYTDEAKPILCALRILRLPESALAAAQSSRVLVLTGGRLRFRHPLLRSVAYQQAAPTHRQRAHAALAEALAGCSDPGRSGQRAWHLAETAADPAGEAQAARALRETADDAQRRGGLVAAAKAYERCALLTPDPDERAPLLVSAAFTRLLTGNVARVGSLVDEAAALTTDGSVLADIANLRGQLALVREPPRQVHDRFLAAAQALRDSEPDRAAALATAAAGAACMGGEVANALAAADLARGLATDPSSPVANAAALLQAQTRMLAGRSPEAPDILRACQPFLDSADPFEVGTEVFSFAAMTLMWLEQYDAARALIARTMNRIRAASALERMPPLLSVAAEVQFRIGRWNEAYVTAAEAAMVGSEVSISLPTAYALSTMARIDAARGRMAQCELNTARLREVLRDSGAAFVAPYADVAEALAHLGAGRARAAAHQLRELAGQLAAAGLREANVLQHHPDVVDALLESGDTEAARGAYEELVEWSERAPSAWATATALRCRATLGPAAEAEDVYQEALRVHDRVPDPFSRARTHLAYGMHLRRAKRRRSAVEQLSAALGLFDTVAAVPWQERTGRELRAAGINTAHAPRQVNELTAQELQIAIAVAEGKTNRELAAALMLSVKTIEYHLGHIFAKLGVCSRVELARRFAREADTGAVTPTRATSPYPGARQGGVARPSRTATSNGELA